MPHRKTDPTATHGAWDLGVPRPPAEPPPVEESYAGDLVLLQRRLEPMEAHLLCGLLRASGIDAMAGDTELVQTNPLWSIALGGAHVRVPATQLAEAQAIHAAYLRGDFELPPEGEDDASPAGQ